jgi:putative membrane protein
MISFFIRVLIVAVGLWLAVRLVPGISINSTQTLLVAALVLGVINAIVRPLLVILTLPITIVTLGLFLLVINGALLYLVGSLVPGVRIASFMAAFLGAIIVSLTSWAASWLFGPGGRYEVTVRERRWWRR